MSTGTLARRIGILLAAMVVAATACSATETVTVNEAAVASATSTAVRNNAGSTDTNGGASTNADGQDSGATAIPTATAEPVETADDSAETRGGDFADSGCRFTFVDDFGDIQIELSFTNQLAEQDDATATYAVYDGNGVALVEDTHFFEELAPGEQVRVQVDTLTDEPTDRGARSGITCELLDIELAPFGFENFRPGGEDSCVFVEIDSFGDIQLEVAVLSPLPDATSLAIDYALRGPGGVRFSDGVAFTDEVSPGGLSTAPVDTFTELPDWVTESTLSCEILSIQGF